MAVAARLVVQSADRNDLDRLQAAVESRISHTSGPPEGLMVHMGYSGMRWGEHTALTADRVRPRLKPSLPKGRRRRVTMYPARTPGGVDPNAMIERRLGEIEPDGRLFTAPKGGLLRRSNWGRFVWDRAAEKVDWPKNAEGTLEWTFHSLRHVFATWALHDARIPIEDLSRLLGHSSTRVTQDIYVHIRPDIYDRFFNATVDSSDRPRADRHAMKGLESEVGPRRHPGSGAGAESMPTAAPDYD